MTAIFTLLLGLSFANVGKSHARNNGGGTPKTNDGCKSTSIDAQVFCGMFLIFLVKHCIQTYKYLDDNSTDNFCSVYFNGELVFDDTSRSRTVDTFPIDDVPKSGTRTFGVILKDNPYSTGEGIWQFESPTFLDGQTDDNGFPIQRQYCLGDGGFRAIFNDTTCGNEIVVSNSEWKCETIVSGPRDIESCFPNWNNDSTADTNISTTITIGGDQDQYQLYDPCIRSSNATFGPNFNNCDCTQDYNPDYVDFAELSVLWSYYQQTG